MAWRMAADPRDLFQIVTTMPSLFVSLWLRVDNKGRTGVFAQPVLISGHIFLARYHRTIVYVIDSANGIRHVIDPERLKCASVCGFVTEAGTDRALEFARASYARSIILLRNVETAEESAANQASYDLFHRLVNSRGTRLYRPSAPSLGGGKFEILLLSPQHLGKLAPGTVVWDWLGERYIVGQDHILFALVFWNRYTAFGLKSSP